MVFEMYTRFQEPKQKLKDKQMILRLVTQSFRCGVGQIYYFISEEIKQNKKKKTNTEIQSEINNFILWIIVRIVSKY